MSTLMIDSSAIKTRSWRGRRSNPCPRCRQCFSYTLLDVSEAPDPFFYCSKCNNILYRKSDANKVGDTAYRWEQLPEDEQLKELEKLWNECLVTAPPCSCGGRFEFWAGIKCPHCGLESSYLVKDPYLRIYNPKIAIVDGAIVFDDTVESSWRCKVEIQ